MKHTNWMADHALKVKKALIADIKASYKSGDIDLDAKVMSIANVNALSYQEAVQACKESDIQIPKVNACY